MNSFKEKLPFIARVVISLLFLLSAFAKLYPTPLYGITKVFEEGQLIPMGFSNDLVPFISRLIIGFEFFIAFAILQFNYLKKLVVPSTILLLLIFSVDLSIDIFIGNADNCGCFGQLIPMTPIEALIKNILTILLLFYIYKNVEDKKSSSFLLLLSSYSIILVLMFALLPIPSNSVAKQTSSFSSYVIDDFNINDGEKILCFFDAGCEHCMDAAKSLNQLSDSIAYFPEMHIIFSDSEADRIPEFFAYVGKEYSHQVLPFYNEDDAINSYLEILGYEYENPAIIYLDNENQIRFYDGTGANAFKAEEFKKLFE